jgi:hypothetical protein
MPRVDDHFDGQLDERWTRTCPGGGLLTVRNSALRMELASAQTGVYSDAQIDDYGSLPPSKFPWRSPLRLELRARASHPAHPAGEAANVHGEQRYLRGTAGFGFWNYPFSLSGAVLRLPDAIWFFYASPPSNMALVPGSPGFGWKAQVVHAHRGRALLAAPPTAASMLWARLTGRETSAAHWVQRLSGSSEAALSSDLTAWHTYTLEWLLNVARFYVDGNLMLAVPDPPRGPLGFVAWVDNQYAIATPRGDFGFGTLASGPEWLELDYLQIAPL